MVNHVLIRESLMTTERWIRMCPCLNKPQFTPRWSTSAPLEFHTCTSCLEHLHSIAIFHNSCRHKLHILACMQQHYLPRSGSPHNVLHSPSNIECEGVHKITENLNSIWYCSTNSGFSLLASYQSTCLGQTMSHTWYQEIEQLVTQIIHSCTHLHPWILATPTDANSVLP